MNMTRLGPVARAGLLRGPALAVLVLVVVAACTPQSAQWSPQQSPKENKVLYLRQTHMARFEPGSDRLSQEERRRLTAFMRRQAAGYGDRITVTTAADPTHPDSQRLASRRGDAVAAYLDRLGIRATVRAKPDPDPGPRDAVTVVIGRYVVIPPACPDWTKRADGDPGNTQSSNFGCATATNLGLMVADPADLLVGRRAPVSDGERAARAIDRYRRGEETPLEKEATQDD